ncbi:RNA-binding protein BRN2-like [Wolffia australiana]
MAEGESVKLFVGQVPKSMSEEELLALFKEVAVVDEVKIIKDRFTKASRGCCFLVSPSREEADKVVDAYHNQRTLPGASTPLQVKYADGELERLEHKLFVGMLPKNVSETELTTLFSKYGVIKDLQILRSSQQTSKGCAFLKYETKEQALAALEAINGKHRMEGSIMPLVVKWADTERERQARRAARAQLQASNLSTGMAIQQPSSFGALPMSYIPAYNGYSYQTSGTYGMLQYPVAPIQSQPGLHYPVKYPGVMNCHLLAHPAPLTIDSTLHSSVTGVQIEGPPGANLFIYHIPQEFTDYDLSQAFQLYGRVLSAKVFIDKATGVSKCFGFVSYDSPAAAQAAISKMNGHMLDGKKMKVQLKSDNKQRRHQ